jgi:hypothetical protein
MRWFWLTEMLGAGPLPNEPLRGEKQLASRFGHTLEPHSPGAKAGFSRLAARVRRFSWEAFITIYTGLYEMHPVLMKYFSSAF